MFMVTLVDGVTDSEGKESTEVPEGQNYLALPGAGMQSTDKLKPGRTQLEPRGATGATRGWEAKA